MRGKSPLSGLSRAQIEHVARLVEAGDEEGAMALHAWLQLLNMALAEGVEAREDFVAVVNSYPYFHLEGSKQGICHYKLFAKGPDGVLVSPLEVFYNFDEMVKWFRRKYA